MTVPVQTAEPEPIYCLWCDQVGHLTTDCYSTHGMNTPWAHEVARLTRAFREGAVQPAEASPEPLTTKRLLDLLVWSDLILEDARDRPEGFDNYATVTKVAALAEKLSSELRLPG